MDIRLRQLSFASLAKAAVLINLAAWLMLGLILGAMEAAGVPLIEPETPPVPLGERVLISILACLLIGAVHSVLLVAGAGLLRLTGRGGPKLHLPDDHRAVSRTFE